jgi:hypothetical protein
MSRSQDLGARCDTRGRRHALLPGLVSRQLFVLHDGALQLLERAGHRVVAMKHIHPLRLVLPGLLS